MLYQSSCGRSLVTLQAGIVLTLILAAPFACISLAQPPVADEVESEMFRAKVYQKRDKLRRDLKMQKKRERWEAVYYTNDWFSHGRGLIVTKREYATLGRGNADMGKVDANDKQIRRISDSRAKHRMTFYVVPWGERVYLVEENNLIHFCNFVNSGAGNSPFGGQDFYQRSQDSEKKVTGLPLVPEQVKDYLLKKPIVGKVLKARHRRTKTSVFGYGDLVGVVSIILDKGKQHGVKRGMSFHPVSDKLGASIYVSSVSDSTCELIVCNIWYWTDEEESIEKGMRLSTRNPLYHGN